MLQIFDRLSRRAVDIVLEAKAKVAELRCRAAQIVPHRVLYGAYIVV
jgi:hypothetical protein